MSDYSTFMYIGFVVATLIAITSFGGVEGLSVTYEAGNQQAAEEYFTLLSGLVDTLQLDAFPILNLDGLLYLVGSIFVIRTPIEILNSIIANGLFFLIVYMAYLFAKDRGVA